MKPALQPTTNRDDPPESAADYLAAMSASLSVIARKNGYETLSYLFELAKLEAAKLRQGEDGGGPRDPASR